MRCLTVILWVAVLTGCSSDPNENLPPLEDVDAPSLGVERVQPMAPPEIGPAARNPDAPFLIVIVDADMRVTELYAGGVPEMNPNFVECAASLQRVRDARIVMGRAPDFCDGVELRPQGPGAPAYIAPGDPDWREEAVDAANATEN